MQLDGKDRAILRDGLGAAFQSYAALRSFLRDRFNFNLNTVADASVGLKTAQDAAIDEAVSNGWIDDLLVECAAHTNSMLSGAAKRVQESLAASHAHLQSVISGARPAALSSLESRFAAYEKRKRSGFVGRQHVFAAIQEFLTPGACGYLTLVGNPGMGKSAILSELTRRIECAARFFFIRAEGITAGSSFGTELTQQLSRKLGICDASTSQLPPSVALGGLLEQAASRLDGGKLIIVVDALDECDDVFGANRAGNLLHLPRDLPRNVFFVMSRRSLDPTVYHIALETEAAVLNKPLDLMSFGDQNRRDVEIYLKAFFEDSEAGAWLLAHRKTVNQGVELLAERSESNFVYLHHVLQHLRAHPTEFEPSSLPQGLREYYIGHWNRMTQGGLGSPAVRHSLELIYVLTAARKPVTRRQLLEVLSDSDPIKFAESIARWREFLEVQAGNDPTYRIYHASFSDFLAEQNPVVGDVDHQRKASGLLRAWALRKLGWKGGT